MKTSPALFTLVFIALTASACTWVQLNESGKRVRLVTAAEVTTCQKIGNVSATTRHEIIKGSARKADVIAKELSTLARNQAATINANTLVAVSPVTDGIQAFIAYQCP